MYWVASKCEIIYVLPFIKRYLFLTLRTINSSSLVKLPALISINKQSFQKVVLLKGLALNKKLTFQRLIFMPNQECNHLRFKSFSIHVFCLHFYSKIVHFVRLPASRREHFKDLLSLFVWFHLYLCCHHLLFLVSVISIYLNCIGSRPLAEWDLEVGQKPKKDVYDVYRKDVYPHASHILTLAAVVPSSYFMHRLDGLAVSCGERELLVFMLNSLIFWARWEMGSCSTVCLKMRKIWNSRSWIPVHVLI